MDDVVKNLLEEWNFSTLAPKFCDEGIDFDAFQLLTEKDIRQLIPQTGPRLKFLQKFKELVSPQIATVPVGETIPLVNEHGEELIVVCAENTHQGKRTQANSESESGNNKRPKPDLSNNSVYQILNCGSTPAQLLKASFLQGLVDDATRNKLAEFIVTSLFGGDNETQIKPPRFQTLAKEIAALFDTEVENTYYIPRVPKSDHSDACPPRGKLYSKYTKLTATLRKTQLRSSKENGDEDEDEDHPNQIASVDATELERAFNWLKNASASLEECRERWALTAKARRQSLTVYLDSNRKRCTKRRAIALAQDYFSSYKCLKQEWGCQLLELDFTLSEYGQFGGALRENWDTVSKKLLVLAKKKGIIVETEEVSTGDERDIRILWLIPALTRPRNVGKWKTKSTDVTEGFLLQVEVEEVAGQEQAQLAKVDEKIRKHSQRLVANGATAQPFPFFVGKFNHSVPLKFRVYMDGFWYAADDAIGAIDRCFKAIHALHLDYPPQSIVPWLFLQQAIYGFSTKWDQKVAQLAGLIKDYESVVLPSSSSTNN